MLFLSSQASLFPCAPVSQSLGLLVAASAPLVSMSGRAWSTGVWDILSALPTGMTMTMEACRGSFRKTSGEGWAQQGLGEHPHFMLCIPLHPQSQCYNPD